MYLSRYFSKFVEEIRLLEDLFGENVLVDEMKMLNVFVVWWNWFELFVCYVKYCVGFFFLYRDSCCVYAASY